MKKYIYKKVYLPTLVEEHYQELDEKRLNELGQEGWELVTIVDNECIFKREISKFHKKEDE
jgi:hypothetical protein